MEKYHVIIDEQIEVRNLSFELEFAKLKDYRQTAKCLNNILEKDRGGISTTLGGKMLINTIDRKKLAPEIVRWLNCRLDERRTKSKSNEKYIRENAEIWLQSIVGQDTGIPAPNEYADFVLAKARDKFKPMTWEMEAVERWAKMKREQPSKTDEQPPSTTDNPDIMTDRAKKYFAKAIQAGFMEQTGNGYKWTFLDGKRGAKAALGYFIKTVYAPNVVSSNQIPFKALGELFGVKRLDSTIYALSGGKRPQRWLGEIDSLFND